jgi:hypothetical protein
LLSVARAHPPTAARRGRAGQAREKRATKEKSRATWTYPPSSSKGGVSVSRRRAWMSMRGVGGMFCTAADGCWAGAEVGVDNPFPLGVSIRCTGTRAGTGTGSFHEGYSSCTTPEGSCR